MRIPQKKTARQYILLEPQQKAQLQALAQRHTTTVAALIRYAVERLLEEQGAAQD
jgi:predicted DNA-binding protein